MSIQLTELKVGQPLPFDVRDSGRILLLRKGWVLHDQNEIQRLIERGVYWSDPAPVLIPKEKDEAPPLAGASAYDVYAFLCLRLQRLSSDALSSVGVFDGFDAYIFDVINIIKHTFDRSPDALLACLMLPLEKQRYSIRHQVDVCILIEAMAKGRRVSRSSVNATMAAALTMNLSMLEAQDTLNKVSKDLPSEVSRLVQTHPTKSAAILRKIGVRDERWIAAVGQHHERLDGSGYPKGIAGSDISIEAQSLAVADVILARLSNSARRQAQLPAKVFWESYEDRGVHLNQKEVAVAIKCLGTYPPGLLVKLNDHSLAVVCSRGKDINHPNVAVLTGSLGMPLPSPQIAEATDDLEIASVLRWSDAAVAFNPLKVWPSPLGSQTI